jgi:hypothetical protein
MCINKQTYNIDNKFDNFDNTNNQSANLETFETYINNLPE